MAFTTSSAHRRCDPMPYITSGIRCAYLGLRNSLLGVLKIIYLPASVSEIFYPNNKIAKFFQHPENSMEANALVAQQLSIQSFESQQMAHTLSARLNRVKQIKDIIGLKQPVRLFLHPGVGGGNCYGSSYSNEILLFLTYDCYTPLSEEEFDFVVASALHCPLQNRVVQKVAQDFCTLTAEIALGYFFTPWAIPLIELAVLPYEIWRERRAVRAAGLSAVAALGTSKGAEAIFQRIIEMSLKYREKEIQARGSSWATFISEKGDYEDDLFSPPVTTRLDYCTTAGHQLS